MCFACFTTQGRAESTNAAGLLSGDDNTAVLPLPQDGQNLPFVRDLPFAQNLLFAQSLPFGQNLSFVRNFPFTKELLFGEDLPCASHVSRP